MKQKTITILIALLILSRFMLDAQDLKPIARKIKDLSSRNSFEKSMLFDRSAENIENNSDSRAVGLEIRKNSINDILSRQPATITLVLPGYGNTVTELELYRAEIFTPDFAIVAASGATMHPEGIHYRGIIKNNPASLAAISIFEDEVMGLISSPENGNYILGKMKGNPRIHVLYPESKLPVNSFDCATIDNDEPYEQKQLQRPEKINGQNCIRLYWEVNYDIFLDKGSLMNTSNYVTGLFNESATIYSNDNIPVELSQVYIWDILSPYTSTAVPGLLAQFQTYRTSFAGDLGNLLGYAGGGGIAAGFAGLCATNTANSQCYSGIATAYNNFPTYSWSVEVVTHEQGHLMGSRHTHACVWNGNNTAIDGCAPSVGYPYEGNCSGAPIPPGGGTIMSYCHMVPAGINFLNGFGPQPSAVILNNYSNAICLSPCGSGLCLTPSNLSTTNVTTTDATFNWDTVPGAVSYDVQYRITGTATWTTDNTLTNSYQAAGLSPGNEYEWQVQTVCSTGASILTLPEIFITVPLTCDVPLNTVTLNITAVSALLDWDAVAGALNYDIRYRETGAPVWNSANTSNTSYSISGLSPVTGYEWQVRTNCAGGDSSAYSPLLNFTTLEVGQQVTVTMQPDSVCGKDATIANCIVCGYYNTNYGSSEELDAIAWTNGGNISDARFLLQFDLTGIPAGSVVQNANLTLFFNPTSSNGSGHSQMSGSNECNIYKITEPWEEHVVTWTNQPATTTVNPGNLPASISPTQDYTVDITTMIQEFVNDPQTNNGMMVQLINETAYRSLIFCSSDHPDVLRHPMLEITYTPVVDTCLHFSYATCNGTDVILASCIPTGYDTTNFGDIGECDAIAWTNSGGTSNARSLLYWDLSAIPVNAVVSSAAISLFTYNSTYNGNHSTLSGANDAYINRVTSPWNENTVTWNTMPTVSTLNQGYLPASTSIYDDYPNIDVTAMVQDMVTNPSSNFGFMLQLVTEINYRSLIFCSSDNPDPAKHPRLDVCYSIPSAIPAVPQANPVTVIQDIKTGEVSVYSQNDFKPGTSFLLFDAAGKLIKSTDHLSGNVFKLPKQELPSGIYFYRLTAPGMEQNGKLMY